MGSMKNWKPDKSKLEKSIIRFDFDSREECIKQERELIIKDRKNVLNRNRHIPGIGFNTAGLGLFVDDNGKIYRVSIDDELVKNGILKQFWEGRKHTEEAKSHMSNSAKHRKINEINEKTRRESISHTLEGKKKTKTHSENISKAKIGDKNPMFGKKAKRVDCPRCGKNISINTSNRYHFDKCKFGK
jgi:ribosomal protein S27AE